MKTYFIRKASRSGSSPYSGPSCQQAGVIPGRVYTSRAEASRDAARLSRYNRVGFEVVPSLSKFKRSSYMSTIRRMLEKYGR